MDRSYSMQREQLLSVSNQVSTYIFAAVIFILPFFFLPITTDALEMPKQALLVIATLILLLLLGMRAILERRFSFRRTPFDLALALLFVTILLSTLFSASRDVSIVGAVPLLCLILFSFLAVNTFTSVGKEKLLVAGLFGSAAILALFTVLQFLNIYILPYPAAKIPSFSLSGSLLTTGMLLFAVLPMGFFSVRSYLSKGFQKGPETIWDSFFLGTSFLIVIGASLVLYQLVTSAKPPLLPQETGLQTALQPLGINFQTALFGTGPATYSFNFTRFKDVELNATTLWNFRPASSSSFFLEALSTLGLLGAISILFLIFRIVTTFFRSSHSTQTTGIFFSLLVILVFSFFLPFSFLSVFLLFALLSLYSISLAHEGNPNIHDVDMSLVTLQKGLITLTPAEASYQTSRNDILPYILFVLFLLIFALVLFGVPNQSQFQTAATRRSFCNQQQGLVCFLVSDMTFQKAIIAANQNQIQQTYDLQNQAIREFPQRDMYHRIFSQTNLAIATLLATQARTATASATDQQNIVTSAQQSINFGRNAIALSPLNVVNWENLTNVYRALIGFAQDADQFAVASARQAIALEPTNPVLHLNLGGIYYQLAQYDLAINEFSQAVNLKPDFANASYNLGHAFEAKGDTQSLQNALVLYQRVRNLVPPNSEDFKKIETEIATLQAKIPGAATGSTETQEGATTQQEPLRISTPSETLPEKKPPVKVEGPPATESATSN